jgi:hypothetical protein
MMDVAAAPTGDGGSSAEVTTVYDESEIVDGAEAELRAAIAMSLEEDTPVATAAAAGATPPTQPAHPPTAAPPLTVEELRAKRLARFG